MAALLLCVACNQAPPKPKPQSSQQAAGGPQVRATVVTIQTTLQPSMKSYAHTLVIANGRARSGDEVDGWRLFDLKKNSVTFVDDVAKTYRTESLQSLIAKRRAALALPQSETLPRVQWSTTNAHRAIQGVEATQSVMKLGAYERQLWIGTHPSIPPELFAMMQASSPLTTSIAGITRAADDALLNVKGFPLADHAELPYGKTKMVVDKQVIRVEQRDVPAAWLNVRGDYKDVTHAPAAAPTPPPKRPAK